MNRMKKFFLSGKGNSILLRINGAYNAFLQKRLSHSYRFRARLYGEGSVRMSNDYDITLFYRWTAGGDIIWFAGICYNLIALDPFEQKKVLEIGCANGWAYRNVYANMRNLEYHGFDIQKIIIDEAVMKAHQKEKETDFQLKYDFIAADAVTEMPEGD